MADTEFIKSVTDRFTLLLGEEKASQIVITESPFETFLTVPAELISVVMTELYDNPALGFDSLVLLTGNDEDDAVKTKNDDGSETLTGGNLSVVYHLESLPNRKKIIIKTIVPKANPEVPSVTPLWVSADWQEREAYDMYGIIFTGHPNLIRILMPYDWEFGFPLRKDYQNPEFYQGIKVPY